MQKSQWHTIGIHTEACAQHIQKQFWKDGVRFEVEHADAKESIWTAETKMGHQNIQKASWQKILHGKMEDEIQQWNMKISEEKKHCDYTIMKIDTKLGTSVQEYNFMWKIIYETDVIGIFLVAAVLQFHMCFYFHVHSYTTVVPHADVVKLHCMSRCDSMMRLLFFEIHFRCS